MCNIASTSCTRSNTATLNKNDNSKKREKKSTTKTVVVLCYPLLYIRERGGLVVNASDSGSRGFKPHSGQTVFCPWARHIYSPKVLGIPRKGWLRPNMTEKLFTGTLRINQPTNQPLQHVYTTGVNQKVLPVLSTETLLHIWLSTEYYGFRPSSTAVDTGGTRGLMMSK